MDLEEVNLKSAVKLTWEMRQTIMQKVAEGMAYMHSEDCYHFDFKAANVLCIKDFRDESTGEIVEY